MARTLARSTRIEQQIKALRFHQHKKVELYLRSPDWLAVDMAYEKEVADFLKSRGLTPEPSRIPEQFHRGLKGYRPKPDPSKT